MFSFPNNGYFDTRGNSKHCSSFRGVNEPSLGKLRLSRLGSFIFGLGLSSSQALKLELELDYCKNQTQETPKNQGNRLLQKPTEREIWAVSVRVDN